MPSQTGAIEFDHHVAVFAAVFHREQDADTKVEPVQQDVARTANAISPAQTIGNQKAIVSLPAGCGRRCVSAGAGVMPAVRTGTPGSGPGSPVVGGWRHHAENEQKPGAEHDRYRREQKRLSEVATPGSPIGEALSAVRSRP